MARVSDFPSLSSSPLKTYLDREDVERMEERCDNLRDLLLIRLLFRTGCRVSEILSLTPSDLFFSQGAVRVVREKERVKLFCPRCSSRLARSHRFCPGCGGEVEEKVRERAMERRQRLLPLDRETLRLAEEYVDRAGLSPHDRIFPISRQTARRVVAEAARKAGLPPLLNPLTGRLRGVSPHRMRDAFAVLALKRDNTVEGMRMLQEHLGHVSFSTTARYRKISGEEHKEWYERVWGEEGNGGKERVGKGVG
jgi:integrase/recombinase XerD